MNDYYKKIFSGFLMVMIDINIGTFDIVPDIIGYLLVFSGIVKLYTITGGNSFRIARYFAIWMTLGAVYELITVTFRLIHLSAFQGYMVMILGVLGELLLVVYIYHGMAAHMKELNEIELSERFGNENKRYALIQGVALIAMSFSINMPKDSSGVYMIVLLLISVVMHIRLLMNLNAVNC